MSNVTTSVLNELRNERDSWLQARRELTVLAQTAKDLGQIKVVACLDEAIRHADQCERRATEMLEATEDIVNALEPK